MSHLPRLLAIGGAHIDRRGQLTVDHVPGASNPGTMREELGGGVFNAASHVRNLGLDVTFLSVRGGDIEGEMVARAIKAAGFDDMSSTFLDRQTASYTAIIDRHGEVITALADMSIYETALPRQIARRATRDAVAASDAILADANMPADAIRRLLSLAAGKPVYMIAISPAKAVRLSGLLGGIHCLFLNMREARALAGFAPPEMPEPQDVLMSLSQGGLCRAVLTDGAAAVHVLENGRVRQLTPPAARHVEDVTGAGDALAGVTTALTMSGRPFHHAVEAGVAAAAATVEGRAAVVDVRKNPRFLELMAALPEDDRKQ